MIMRDPAKGRGYPKILYHTSRTFVKRFLVFFEKNIFNFFSFFLKKRLTNSRNYGIIKVRKTKESKSYVQIKGNQNQRRGNA